MTYRFPISALVMGGDVNGLGHIRALGRAGIRTLLICPEASKKSVARFSKYCYKAVFTPDPQDDSAIRRALSEVRRIVAGPCVLFATSDHYVDFMDRFRDSLQPDFLFNLPDSDTLKILTNKLASQRIAMHFGIEAPKTQPLKSFNLDMVPAQKLRFPCIIKPIDSFSVQFPWKNKVVQSDEEVADFASKYPLLVENSVVQELIPGSEENIFQCTGYIANTSLSAFCVIQKIHQFPPGYGTTTLGRTCVSPELREKTESFLRNLNYRGFASVEYKRSTNNGRFYFIEVNPRLPWYNALFLSSGVNLPYLQYLDVSNQSDGNDLMIEQTEGVHWLHFRNELAGICHRVKDGEPIHFGRLVRQILKVRSFAYFHLSDWKPFIAGCLGQLWTDVSKLFGRAPIA